MADRSETTHEEEYEPTAAWFRDGSAQQIATDVTGVEEPQRAQEALFEFFDQFQAGATILNVGSGGNSFTHFLEERYPHLNFIALDKAYMKGSPFKIGKDIVKSEHMLGCRWESIDLPDASVDGFFCCNSFPYYPEDIWRMEETVRELSRVAKTGARIMFNGKSEFGSRLDEGTFERLMGANGWTITIENRKSYGYDATIIYCGRGERG